MLQRISALVAMTLAAGCMNGDVDAPAITSVQQEIGGTCAEWACGTNSPEIANFGFWDLQLPPSIGVPGQPNKAGFQLLGFVKDGKWYLPRVHAGKLTATDKGGTMLAGSALVKGWFAILLEKERRTFKLEITEVGRAISWARPAGGGLVVLESYKLDWTEFVGGVPNKERRNVCNNPPNQDSGELLNMHQFHTLLFEGDRILAKEKQDVGIDNSWFNLGCAGSTLAKMALTGHTEGSRNAGTFITDLKERQAMLKLLTGDYCGDGTPFTVAGQRLSWADHHGWMKLAVVPLEREARWNHDGPVCLDEPRVDVQPTALAIATFGLAPPIYDQMQAYCPLKVPPPCAGTPFGTDGLHLISATPL